MESAYRDEYGDRVGNFPTSFPFEKVDVNNSQSSRPRLGSRMSICLPSKGFMNSPGDNNCFLNAAIQVWGFEKKFNVGLNYFDLRLLCEFKYGHFEGILVFLVVCYKAIKYSPLLKNNYLSKQYKDKNNTSHCSDFTGSFKTSIKNLEINNCQNYARILQCVLYCMEISKTFGV